MIGSKSVAEAHGAAPYKNIMENLIEYHSNIMVEHRFSTKWTWVSRWLVHNLSDPRLDSLARGLIIFTKVYKSVLKWLTSVLNHQNLH